MIYVLMKSLYIEDQHIRDVPINYSTDEAIMEAYCDKLNDLAVDIDNALIEGSFFTKLDDWHSSSYCEDGAYGVDYDKAYEHFVHRYFRDLGWTEEQYQDISLVVDGRDFLEIPHFYMYRVPDELLP